MTDPIFFPDEVVMLWFKRALVFALAVILALATLVFVLENQQSTTLSYLGFATPELPVSLYVVVAFVAGGLLGMLLGVLVASRLKYRLKAVEARLARKTEEVQRLRTDTASVSVATSSV